MYLSKKTHISRWSDDDIEITIKKGGKNFQKIDTDRISDIVEQIAYWRKFNALHKWFVDNCQGGVDDCGEYPVSSEQINDLLSILKEIHNAYTQKESKGISKAEKLLPSSSGFFFGSEEYDSWYFQNIEQTISIFESLIQEDSNLYGLYYQASW